MRREPKFSYWEIILVSRWDLKIVTLLKKKQYIQIKGVIKYFQTPEVSWKRRSDFLSLISFVLHSRSPCIALSPHLTQLQKSTIRPWCPNFDCCGCSNTPTHHTSDRRALLPTSPINHLHPSHQWCRWHHWPQLLQSRKMELPENPLPLRPSVLCCSFYNNSILT
jgi:hypothetical protein